MIFIDCLILKYGCDVLHKQLSRGLQETSYVLKNFVKFSGKCWSQSLLFNKVTSCRSVILLIRDSGRGIFL